MRKALIMLLLAALWTTANAQATTGREQAGLLGTVKTVTAEVTEFTGMDGRRVEGRRTPTRSITYGARGNVVKQVDYNPAGSVRTLR